MRFEAPSAVEAWLVSRAVLRWAASRVVPCGRRSTQSGRALQRFGSYPSSWHQRGLHGNSRNVWSAARLPTKRPLRVGRNRYYNIGQRKIPT